MRCANSPQCRWRHLSTISDVETFELFTNIARRLGVGSDYYQDKRKECMNEGQATSALRITAG